MAEKAMVLPSLFVCMRHLKCYLKNVLLDLESIEDYHFVMSSDESQFIESMPAGQRLLKALDNVEAAIKNGGGASAGSASATSGEDFSAEKEVLRNQVDSLIEKIEGALHD